MTNNRYLGCDDLYQLFQDIPDHAQNPVTLEDCKSMIISVCGDIFYKDDARVSLAQFQGLCLCEH
jgi:hypothetical protein